MLPVTSLLVKESKIYVLKSTIIIIFSIIFFNVDSSFDIENRTLSLSVVIIDMLMKGTMFQIFYLGPRLLFMWLQNDAYKF